MPTYQTLTIQTWWYNFDVKPLANGDLLESVYLFRKESGEAVFRTFGFTDSHDREMTFAFDEALISSAGRCFLQGMTLRSRADQAEYDRGERPTTVEVDPCYLLSFFALYRLPIPRRLLDFVQIEPPDLTPPARVELKTCFLRSGEAWVQQPRPLSVKEAEFLGVLISAYPRRVGIEQMMQSHGIRCPSKTRDRINKKFPGLLSKKYEDGKGYGFSKANAAT